MLSLRVILLSLTLSLVAAHSFLTDPDAYYRKFQLRNCVGSECQQACPTFPINRDFMRNTQERPARTWQRGERVTIRWAKNNHNNGFVRFSIVPVNVMMNRQWHTRLSFYHGCFIQGAFRCHGEQECGADKSNTAFHRDIDIPTIYPDGDYVMAMVWYGGARAPLNVADRFSDYFSCSYVRIEGGPLQGGVQPFFDTGDVMPTRNQEEGKCLSAIDAPGVCHKDGCKTMADWKVPRGFRNGNQPPMVTVSDVVEARQA